MTIAEQGDELMKLRQEEFKLIIENNQLNVKREEFVWDVVLKWVDRDPERRKNDLLFLLPKIRFGLMDSKYFIENVMIIIWQYLKVLVPTIILLAQKKKKKIVLYLYARLDLGKLKVLVERRQITK